MAHKMARMLHLEFVGLGWSDSTRAPGLQATKFGALKGWWPARPAGWSYSAYIVRIVLLLFQRHADELAARAHTGLREQLLQGGFH